jgi:predicted DNA-binding protein with PD1-like motif
MKNDSPTSDGQGMPSSRRLLQPGPTAPERIESLEGHGQALELSLEPGLNLIEAIARPLLEAGFEGAAVRLEGGSLGPFTYLIPADSTDARYAAYYSEPFTPAGETRLEVATVTVGRRDGQPFLHCHGLWIEADGQRRGGHPIPDQTYVASPPKARAWAFSDVALRSEFDPETNFTLFHPVRLDHPVAREGPRTVAARIRPNEDVSESVEAICRRHGFTAARVRGSLGSIIDPVFEGGERVGSDSTELLVLDGAVRSDESGRLRSQLDIALVDTGGRVHEGRLVPGRNPVCITFELVIEEQIS